MATYLATASIGELDIHAYKAKGLPYWDAIDPVLFEPPPPPPTITPTDGEQMLFSQVADPAYKRLTRVIHGAARRGDAVVRCIPRHGILGLGSPVRRAADRWR